MTAILLALAVLAALPIAPARAETVTVALPSGWAVTDLPAPEQDGHPVAGFRRRALLPGASNRPAAAIKLVVLPQERDHSLELATIMRTALQTAADSFEQNHLTDTCNPRRRCRCQATPGSAAPAPSGTAIRSWCARTSSSPSPRPPC